MHATGRYYGPPKPRPQNPPTQLKKQQKGENKVEKRTSGTARNRQNAVKTNTKRQKNNKNATAICGRWSNYIKLWL